MLESQNKVIQHIIRKKKERLPGCESPLPIAIDGRSGTGKSTLSKQLAGERDATRITRFNRYQNID